MLQTNPLEELPLRALAHALRAGDVSSEAVVAHYLARIDAVDPSLHALVRRAPDALEHARTADLARIRGEPCGPLHGVPFSVKDWIEVAGLVCDGGFIERRDFVPKRDATVIARLRAAGGIVLGKSKTGASASLLHPACHNPIAPERTPGGSSSGEAALTAARATPFGIGSDSGGSIRWPAHCCGVAGLKPSHGRVPNTGHFPPIGALQDPRTVIGPLARRVDDLAYVLDLIAGADGVDPAALPVRLDDTNGAGPWRVAWFGGWEGERRGWDFRAGSREYTIGTDATGAAALSHAVAALRDAGHTLVEAVPPRIEEARAITEAYWARRQSVSLRTWLPPAQDTSANTIDADAIEHSLFAWERLRRAMLDYMRDYDLLLCPAAPRVAPRPAEESMDDFAFTLPFSLTGQPVVCLAAAWDAEGLPAAVQVIAPRFLEQRALAVAREIELRC